MADILRKYLGVILTALFASSLIEFFMRNTNRNAKVMQITSESYSLPPQAISELPAITSAPVGIVNETIKVKEVAGVIPTPVATIVPAPTSAGAWSVNATATPVSVSPSALDNGAASQAAPDIFTGLVNTMTAHPGLLFLMGCLFIIAIFVIVEYRKRK